MRSGSTIMGSRHLSLRGSRTMQRLGKESAQPGRRLLPVSLEFFHPLPSMRSWYEAHCLRLRHDDAMIVCKPPRVAPFVFSRLMPMCVISLRGLDAFHPSSVISRGA